MLRSVNKLSGYKIIATDGEIGKVNDFYFDDRSWTMRYLVVDTGKWLPGRQVLISPVSLGQPDWEEKAFPVNLTKEQVENSPNIDEHQPVYRQKELELIKYYNWPDYWRTFDPYVPTTALVIARDLPEHKEKDEEVNPHLRSTEEVTGYRIQAKNGEIGHVEDFIVEDQTWIIRYMLIDTKNWLPWGKKVLVSPAWAEGISWVEGKVFIELTRELIKNSPEFDPSEPVNREYEMRLYDYYGRPKYWE